MLQTNSIITITFVIYSIFTFLIGIYAYKKTSSSSDYFIGGRSLGPWTTALSAGASDMSGWLLLGLPGYAFIAGFESIWLAIGLLFGTWLNWLLLAKRLRSFSISLDDALTLPQYLSRRFNDKLGFLQPICAIFILLFFTFYTSSGFVAGGKLFETVFDVEYETAVIIGATCVVLYTLVGGFLAVAWTDLFQGLLMSLALLIVPICVLSQFNIDINTDLTKINPNLLNILNDKNGNPLSIIAILSLLGWGLGYFGQPHILARFKASRKNSELVFARRIAVIWTALSMFGAFLVGIAGFIYTQKQGIVVNDSEKIFMLLVNTLFNPVVAGILLAAILAAIMSTADSQLLVSSSALSEDLYKKLFNKNASSTQIMWIGRLAVLIVSLIAVYLALHPDNTVLNLVSYAWAGFGASFGPVVIFSLYWRKMTTLSAYLGVITGGITTVIWKQLEGGIFDLYEIIPAFIISSLVIIIISLLGKKEDEIIEKQFDDFLVELEK